MIWIFLASTLTLSAPLILAGMGGLTSERSGVINIGLEGKMLGAAATVAIVGTNTNSALLGLTAALGAGVLLSLFHWLMTQTYRIDHVISGMAINSIAYGATHFLSRKFLDPDSAEKVPSIPSVVLYVLAFALPVALWWFLSRTRGGLRQTAVGQDPSKSRQMGVAPERVRLWSLVATGVLCGLAGAIVIAQSGHFLDSMSGRGFVALAALILGGWRPLPTLYTCLVFGALQALQLQLQGTELMGAHIPTEVWLSLPYVATVIALAGFMGKRSRAPSGLGKA